MADNIPVTGGSGYTVATDEVTRNATSEHQQIVKIGLGAEGAHDIVVDSGQQTMANSLPVVIASNQSAVPAKVQDGAGNNLTSEPIDSGAAFLNTFPALAWISADGGVVEVGSTSTVINITAHTARPGDLIQFPNGAVTCKKQSRIVVSVTANTITLNRAFDGTPTTDDTCYFYRRGFLKTDEDGVAYVQIDGGNVNVSAAATFPIQTEAQLDFDTDGGDTSNVSVIGIALPSASGPVIGGTSTNPVVVSVGAALPAGTNAIGKLSANNGVDIGDVDVASVTPGTAAANLGKAEDDVHNSGDVGVMALGVRKDTAAATAADGDYQPFIFDSTGKLHVNVGNSVTINSPAVTNAGTFAVQVDGSALTSLQLIDDSVVADDAAFTPATTKVLMAGFEFDDSSPDSVDEGDAGAARMSANRNIYTQIRDAAGSERGVNVNASNQLAVAGPVTNAGTFAVQVDGSALTSLQLIDDVVYTDDTSTHSTGTSKGSLIMAAATPTDTTVDANDIGAVAMTTNRAMHMSIRDAAGNTRGVNVDASNRLSMTIEGVAGSAVATVGTGAMKVGVVGASNFAFDSQIGASTAPPNQVVVGYIYNSTAPAPTSGQAMAQQADQAGNQRTFPGIAFATPGTWSSATALNTTFSIFTNSGAPDVIVHLEQDTGSFSAGAITFEVTFDGTNWVTISADAVIDPSSTTLTTIPVPYTLVTTTNKPFLLLSKGARGLRIKLSTAITGTGQVVVRYSLLPYPVVQQTILGTGSAAIGKLAANDGVDIGDVTINNASGGSAVNIQDGGNTITVDGTITASNTAGDIAHDAGDSGNPVKVGGKAANAFPTAVANNDRANLITDLFGRLLTAEIDPAMQKHINKNFTSTQTGTDVWSPTSGKRIAVTSVVIGAYGTTAARVILWFGDNADTTFTQDSDQVLVAASFAPSSTSKPGLVFAPHTPVFCTTVDRELHITTDAGISLDITIEGYEW